MTNQELKEKLKKKQYTISKQADFENTGINWYAYKTSIDTQDCTCNDKPPQIIITPWRIDISHTENETLYSSEISIKGEILGKHWIDIKLYAVPWKDLLPNLDLFERILADTWNCAAKAKQEIFSVVQEIDDEVA